jgi:cytochrome P450
MTVNPTNDERPERDTATAHDRCPVTGHGTLAWSTDFDHADPAYNANAPEIWAGLRGSCPVAHTDRYGGVWLPVTHDDVHAIAYDTEHFSSVGVVVSNQRPDWDQAPLGGAAPITSDPPAHHAARRLLLPAFSPKAIDPWEAEIRTLCRQLLDDAEASLGSDRVLDAAVQYAQHIPVNVIVRMLGMPLEDADLFREFVHVVLEAVDVTPEERLGSLHRLGDYIRASIEDHRLHPREDLIGYLVAQCDEHGEPLTEQHIVGSIILLLVAGIDTTWSAIGSALFHLATHAEDRERLVADPSLMPTAVEEFLRAYAPVTMARVVREDVEIGDVTMKRGDWTLLPFPSANLDPAVFDRADEVLIDRAENRHAAFGLGIHRCLGSNLARLELRVAVEEFLARFPSFHLAGDVRWSVGQVRGPRRLPVRVA